MTPVQPRNVEQRATVLGMEDVQSVGFNAKQFESHQLIKGTEP